MDAERAVPVTGLTPVHFTALLAAAMTVSMAYGVTLPFLPFILERVLQPEQSGAVPWHTGLLTALYTLALFLLSPLWGILSHRFNRRIILTARIAVVGWAKPTQLTWRSNDKYRVDFAHPTKLSGLVSE